MLHECALGEAFAAPLLRFRPQPRLSRGHLLVQSLLVSVLVPFIYRELGFGRAVRGGLRMACPLSCPCGVYISDHSDASRILRTGFRIGNVYRYIFQTPHAMRILDF